MFPLLFAIVWIPCVLLAQAPSGPAVPPGLEALTLEQAVTEAIDKNLGVIAEKFNVSVANARIVTAGLRPNPVLSLGGDHLDLVGTGYNNVNNAGPAEFSLRTDFVLERGGKRARRVEVAENAKTVVELQLLNTVRGIVIDVQNAFVEVLQAKSNLALAEENLKSLNGIVRINETRVKSGDLAEVELLRVQLAELQFENAVRQAGLRVQTARARLQVLLGRDRLARKLDAAGDLRRETVQLPVDALTELALQARPDLQALRRDQARSLAELKLQLAQGRVDYTVGTEFRRQEGLAGKGNSLGVFFSTTLPVYNRNQGEIERARQEQQQLEARLRAARLAIESEVEIAYMQYSNARANLEKIEGTMIQKAKDVRHITEFSYTRGEATLVEFLDAQRAYNDTIQTYNEARAEYARSLYTIDAATGKSPR